MNGRDHYVASIAYALHTAGNLEEALSLVCQIGTEDMRANAMWEVLYAQKQRGDGSNAERAAAKIENEEVKKQAFGIIANINRGTYEQNLQIEVLRGYAPS